MQQKNIFTLSSPVPIAGFVSKNRLGSKKIMLQIMVHLAAWLCFLMLPFAFIPRPKDGAFIPEQYISFYFLLSSFMYISFYYLNFYLLVPKLLAKKNVILYILLILGLLIFFGVFPRLYRYGSDLHRLPPIPWETGRMHRLSPPLLHAGSIAIFLMVFIVSTGVKVVSQWFEYEKKNREIENEKLTTELSFLKSQINPHFLFNTLNNIYSLAEAHSEKTAETVLKLSSIMRYVLTEAKNNSVPLDKEIQFTRNYIELQKMRLTDKSKVDFVITGDTEGKQISPMLFLPFIENAFKYGISTREPSPIEINLTIGNKEIDFNIRNNKYANALRSPSDKTGIGIVNVKRRLDLLYSNRYSLNLADDMATFQVNLNIRL